jgi:hypothetical protein
MNAEDNEILRRSLVFCFLSDEHFETIEPLLPPWGRRQECEAGTGRISINYWDPVP